MDDLFKPEDTREEALRYGNLRSYQEFVYNELPKAPRTVETNTEYGEIVPEDITGSSTIL